MLAWRAEIWSHSGWWVLLLSDNIIKYFISNKKEERLILSYRPDTNILYECRLHLKTSCELDVIEAAGGAGLQALRQRDSTAHQWQISDGVTLALSA